MCQRERERDQIFYSAIFLVNVDLEKKKEKKKKGESLLPTCLLELNFVASICEIWNKNGFKSLLKIL